MMLKNKKGLIIIGIMVFAMLSFVACKKDKKEETDQKVEENTIGLEVKDEADADGEDEIDFDDMDADDESTSDKKGSSDKKEDKNQDDEKDTADKDSEKDKDNKEDDNSGNTGSNEGDKGEDEAYGPFF